MRRIALSAAVLLALMPVSAEAAGTRLSTTLTGAEEAPGPGDEDATGFASLRLNQGRGRICFDISWADVDGTVTAAHIHEAPPGEPGDVVVPLFEGEYESTDSESACVTGVARSLIKDIRTNPTDYYVNVHSTDFPGGAIRGQLGD